VRRAAVRLAADSPPIATELERAAELFRGQVAATLGRELAGAGPGTLDAVDLVTSWEAWERLRTTQGLTVTGAGAVVRRTLTALLAAGGAATPAGR
jgi:hypothetical protein